MHYYICPHCGASLYVAIQWDSVICPFCRGEIVFPPMVLIEKESLDVWRHLYQKDKKNKKDQK